MWDFYYNSFCAALASLTASLTYRSVAGRIHDASKKRVFAALIIGAAAGTFTLVITTALPHHFLSLRRLLLPPAAIEGVWIQQHQEPTNAKYSTVRFGYDPATRSFIVTGRSARVSSASTGVVVEPRADWRSNSVGVDSIPDGFRIHYTYTATMKEGPFERLDGFGEMNIDCKDGRCTYGDGYYKDTAQKEPMNFTLHRLCGDAERLLTTDPLALIKAYVDKPKQFACIDASVQ